jgi:hypothetical protein
MCSTARESRRSPSASTLPTTTIMTTSLSRVDRQQVCWCWMHLWLTQTTELGDSMFAPHDTPDVHSVPTTTCSSSRACKPAKAILQLAPWLLGARLLLFLVFVEGVEAVDFGLCLSLLLQLQMSQINTRGPTSSASSFSSRLSSTFTEPFFSLVSCSTSLPRPEEKARHRHT